MRLLCILALCLVAAADGYKVLCIFALPSKSHHHLGQGIVKSLLRAGHEVTWLTGFPPKNPEKGVTIIDGSAVNSITAGIDMTDKRNTQMGMGFIREFATNMSLATLNVQGLKEILVKEQFDAIATETFYSDLDAGYAAIQQVPWIVLSGMVLQPPVEALVDDVKSVATIPMIFNDFPIPMNFFQRVTNVGMHFGMVLSDWWCESETEALYRSMFGPLATARGVPLPPLQEALNNVSILFVNSHDSFAPAQSLPPNVVDIGGYHIEDSKTPLPKDLQELLDSSTHGVVYFSMGSVIKTSSLPAQTKKDLVKMLGEFPQTVLWKFEEELEGLPANVHVRPWMPQAAILAHKNVKVFITHGGLLSTLESLHFGVPVIAVPVFGDQPANAARAVRAGYAIRVDFEPNTMADGLRVALKEALSTDKYYKQVKYLSFLFNKRPVAPTKLISHYIELAIETKGAFHLRSKSKEYAWYQRWLIDQLAVLLAILFIIYQIIKKALCFIVNKITGSKKPTSNKKVKRN